MRPPCRSRRSIGRLCGPLSLGKLGQRSLDIEQRMRLHLDHGDLSRRREPANNLTDLGSRGKRRKKTLRIVGARRDHRLQVHRGEDRQRRNLRHADAGVHRLLMPGLQRLPECFPLVFLIKGDHPHRGPKLMQRAQSCGFCEFPPKLFANLRRGQNSALFE
jgi:hypothetical protein